MIALRPWTIKRGKTNQFQLVNDPNPPFHTFLHPVSSSLLGPTNISTPPSLFPAPPPTSKNKLLYWQILKTMQL